MLTSADPSAVPTDGIAGWVLNVMESLGSAGAGALVALENVFPPLPSEIILPLAGFTASQGDLNLGAAIILTTLGSVVGALVLYGIGAALGRRRMYVIVDRLPLVDVDDLESAEKWFDRHGQLAVFVGRLVPLVRSLISVPAGVESMPLANFLALTTAGSLLWNSALILAGYWLGEQWHVVEGYVGTFQWVVIAAILVGLAWWIAVKVRKARQSAG